MAKGYQQPNLFRESEYLYSISYGNRIKISKWWIISILTFLCVVTPFTNWMIPLFVKRIKDFKIRY